MRRHRCAFVYALLAAFIDPPEVWAVFGDDLLQSDDAAARFEELIGTRGSPHSIRLEAGPRLPRRLGCAWSLAADVLYADFEPTVHTPSQV